MKSTLELSAGRFYTVIVVDAATLLEDPSLGNHVKRLSLRCNLSNEAVMLKTANGAPKVISAVGSGSSSTEVNPISAALRVFAGAAALETFAELQLERGAVYSAFVLPNGVATFEPSALWVTNVVIGFQETFSGACDAVSVLK